MTLKELISQVIREGSGGILTDESRFDFTDIESKIHYARATAILQQFSKTKRLSPLWIQSYQSEYSTQLQDGELNFVRFEAPAFLTLDSFRDGLVYVGSVKGNKQYRRVNNLAELSVYNSYRITKLNENLPVFIYSDGYILVYGDTMIKSLKIEGVFQNPTDIPTYNQDVDNYPISEDLIVTIKDLIYKTSTQIELQRKPDITSDSAESSSIPSKNNQ